MRRPIHLTVGLLIVIALAGSAFARNPIRRTFSEWSESEYAATGVYAPQFAGAKPDGIVGKCQDCHMPDEAGKGADTGPNRTDIGVHDFTGGNYFIPDILADYFPAEVNQAARDGGRARVIGMLQKAASLEVEEIVGAGVPSILVTVTNETGHKLPSGYPEGRRIWLNVKAYDDAMQLVYESGAYDGATGELTYDEDLKIYHIKPGRSERLAALLGVPSGPAFNFALNDTVYLDNRIPPPDGGPAGRPPPLDVRSHWTRLRR